MSTEEHAQFLADAMMQHPGVTLHLDAQHAFMLCATLQLANRHPGVAGGSLGGLLRDVVDGISAELGQPFAAIIAAGWDPTLDVAL